MTGGPDRPGDGSGDLPKRFGPYQVRGLIGAGGMGIVYRALDEALQREVALKTLLPALATDPEFVARFKREAQSAAALNHPNITQIYSIGQEGHLPFFAMEMIHGRSLEGLLKERGPLDAVEAAGYIAQAAKGLRHAAQRKLIHRDVKPSNLMLTEEGVVKITDFGLAKAARSESQITVTGQVLGSPGYISPEQAQGGELDARSDIYSLGATFYQLVTGRLPFEAPTPVAMIIKHMNEPLRSPRAVNPAIPYPIASAIQKMMAKRPGERFQEYDALIRELERSADSVRPAGAGQRQPVSPGAAGAPAWPAATGVDGRSPRGRAGQGGPGGGRPGAGGPGDAQEAGIEGGRGSRVPLVLAIALGALIVFGLVRHRLMARPSQGDADARPRVATSGATTLEGSSSTPAGPAAGGGVEVQGSFSTRPAVGGFRDGNRDRGTIEERFRERFRQKSRANLSFVSNDHEVLPDGRLRVFGRVQNNGGAAATQARARIRILLDNGEVAAQGETSLTPPLIPPGASASFELPLDYSGPVGTIKAELTWLE